MNNATTVAGMMSIDAIDASSSSISSDSSDSSSSDSSSGNTTIVIETLRIYGSFYLFSVVLYGTILYRRYPHLYNIRSWSSLSSVSMSSSSSVSMPSSSSVSMSSSSRPNQPPQHTQDIEEEEEEEEEDHPSPPTTTPTPTTTTTPTTPTTPNLAHTTYTSPSSVTWMYEVFVRYTNDIQLLHHCGMDQLCFLRALRFGRQLSFIGCCNAIWLIPLYYTVVIPIPTTTTTTTTTTTIIDPLSLISVSHLPSSSKRFIGTVIAAYVTYIYAMYMIYLEYQWYTKMKHYYLSQTLPQNYTVHVSGIPRVYRSSHQLANYFRQCSSGNSSGCSGTGNNSNNHNNNNHDSVVYEAHIVLETPKLDKLIERRNTIVQKLEHTVAMERKTGQLRSHRTLSNHKRYHHHSRHHSRSPPSPQQRHPRRTLRKVESVLTYEDELQQLNHTIQNGIQNIRSRGLLTHQQYNNNSNNHSHHHHHHHSSNSQLLSPHNNNNGSHHSRRLLRRHVASKDLLAAIRADLQSDINHDNDDDNNNDVSDYENDNDHVHCDKNGYRSSPDNNDTDLLLKRNGSDDDDNNSGAISVSGVVPPTRLTPSIELESMIHDEATTTNIPNEEEEESKDDNVPLDAANEPNETSSSSSLELNCMIGNTSGSTSSPFQNSIRRGMMSGTTAVRDSIGTFVVNSTVAGTTIVKSSIRACGTSLVQTSKLASTTLLQTATETGAETIRRAQSVGTNVMHSTGSVVPTFLRNRTEGKVTDAGFVVFTSLYATQTVLQMIHHPKPYVMSVLPAGHADDIYWSNVGLRHQAKRSGTMASIAATSVLCFFWSIPMAFISSLTEIGTIKESIPKLGEWIERYPFMETLLAQLAPMLLLIFNETILPVLLKYFATWEGHISSSLLEASLFVKLGCFMIIQTFFVQVLSGGIWSTLTDIVDEPENLINLLAQSLPDRSSYFIQIVLAQTFFLQSMELLRVYPLTVQLLRRYIGPRLTKKERSKPYGILHPLECPPDFWHAETFAQLILFYMISFVYSPIAPITSVVLYFCFVVLESGYRYQFVHNYPKSCTDSGGRIWKFFIHFTLGCMVVAQLTLIGILLLKQSHYAGPAMGPLLAITILFIFFINDEHSKVSEYLPTRECILKDSENSMMENVDDENVCTMDFAKDIYMQPSLRNSDPIEPDYDDL